MTLLTRTTRRMELTEEGALFLQKARGIVASLEEAEECMRMVHQQPAGRLRVDASAPVMLHCVVPHVAEFRRAYPAITLELTSNDRIVDLMEHRSDVALRAGPDRLHTAPARCARAALAAGQPDYIARRGEPKDVDELLQHELLGFTQPESLSIWPLRRGRLQLRHHAHAGHLQRRDPVPAGAARRGHRLPVRLHGARQAGRRPAGEGDGTRVHRLPAAADTVYYRNTQLSRRIACFLDFIAARM